MDKNSGVPEKTGLRGVEGVYCATLWGLAGVYGAIMLCAKKINENANQLEVTILHTRQAVDKALNLLKKLVLK